MIGIEIALSIHQQLIARYGGSEGLRSKEALEAALHRPFATFDGQELYPTPLEKAAAMIESILINHPFIDGNKRTGYVLMKFVLFLYGYNVQAADEEKYQFVVNIAAGELKLDAIKAWLEKRIVKLTYNL